MVMVDIQPLPVVLRNSYENKTLLFNIDEETSH